MLNVEIDGTEVTFDESQHKYYADDLEVPSVTTVTGVIDKGQGFYNWLVNQTAEYFEDNLEPGESYDEAEISDMIIEAKNNRYKSSGRAMKIGTIVHEFAEDYMQAQINDTEEPDLPINEKARKSANAFLDWFSEFNIKPIETEQICFHGAMPRDGIMSYAGTFDLLCEVDGVETVLDFKTSKGIYDEYWMQVVAYRNAVVYQRSVAHRDKLPLQAGIVRFPKEKADFEVEIETSLGKMEEHFQAFKAARQILHWQRNVV